MSCSSHSLHRFMVHSRPASLFNFRSTSLNEATPWIWLRYFSASDDQEQCPEVTGLRQGNAGPLQLTFYLQESYPLPGGVRSHQTGDFCLFPQFHFFTYWSEISWQANCLSASSRTHFSCITVKYDERDCFLKDMFVDLALQLNCSGQRLWLRSRWETVVMCSSLPLLCLTKWDGNQSEGSSLHWNPASFNETRNSSPKSPW